MSRRHVPPARMYPAGEAGIRAHFVEIAGGLRIRVVESGPSAGAPVLMVHGWGGCVYTFAEQIPALAAAGYRAIAIDLPGHGLSDKPTDESHYTERALSDAVLATVAALGIGRFTYIGHSMGGALGLGLAIARHEAIERLALMNAARLGGAPIVRPARWLTPRFANRWAPRLMTRSTIRMVLNLAFGTPDRPTERDIDEYWAPFQFPEAVWANRAILHRFNFDPVSDDQLRSIAMPVLVVHGGRDRLIFNVGERARLIRDARVLAIPQAGHLALQECASLVNPEILNLLR